jgi:hypothetical protein
MSGARFTWGVIVFLVGIICTILYLGSSYAPHVGSTVEFGLWGGFLNGWFLFLTGIISLFNDSWTIFQPVNNGNCYVFGFLLGVFAFPGVIRLLL